jgi:hypothetical protein
MLFLSEKSIHGPASAYMRPRPTEMGEDIGVVTTGFFQRVREDSEPPVVQCAGRLVPLIVGRLGEADHGRVIPGQDGAGEGDGAKRVAEDVVHKGHYLLRFDFLGC